jgi:hypothetical protein
MRFIRFSPALVLLTAMCVGQSSSTDPAAQSSSSTTTPTDPNKPPENPLQEPVKPTEQEQAKPKAAAFDLGGAASGQDQQLGEIKLMSRYTQVGGDQTRSFRVPGSNNLGEFNYFVDRSFAMSRRVQVLTMYRSTDDQSIDPEHNSLQKAYVRLFGAHDEYIVGDALVNYSRLSFNQNIKGLSFTREVADGWKLSGVGGVFIDRYGSLYKDLVGRPYMANVFGSRLERRLFNKESKAGLNFSSSVDQTGTLPPTANGISPFPTNNKLFSLDSKMQFKNGLRFDGEFAYSLTDFDRRFTGLCAAPCDTRSPQPSLDRNQGDWGGRLEGNWRLKKLSLRSSYVRYQPNFASTNARQISDLQDFAFRSSYDLTDWMTVDGTVRRSNNDLKQQLPFKTTLWGPEAKFVFHDLGFYKRGTFEVGYRQRLVDASDGSISRSVRTPFAEFTFPVKQIFFTAGYERRQARDLIEASQASNTDRFSLGIRGIFDIANWQINPTLRWELERQSHRPRIENLPIDFTLDRDSNRLGSATIFIEAPKYFMIEAGFRDSSATIFGPNGFSRPQYKTAITYKFHNDENMLFIASFERNNNFYFTSSNYDERVWSGTIVYRFGRKAQ